MLCPKCLCEIPDEPTRPTSNRIVYLISVILGICGLSASVASVLVDTLTHTVSYIPPLIDRSEFNEIFFHVIDVAFVLFSASTIFFTLSILLLTASMIIAMLARSPKTKVFRVLRSIAIVICGLCGGGAILLRAVLDWLAYSYSRGASEPAAWMFIAVLPLISAFISLGFSKLMCVIAAIFMRKGNRVPMLLAILSLLLPPLFAGLAMLMHVLVFAGSVSYVAFLLIAVVLLHAL